ncbi:MAG: type II secretion system protein GspD, partial [Sulfitobacter sp. SK025]
MNSRLPSLLVFVILGAIALGRPQMALAQETFVINLRGAEISLLAEQVSDITGRTLVLDPNLTGEVTVVSKQPLDREGVWALFQSILRVRGFAAVETGSVWQIVPELDARTKGSPQKLVIPGS